MWRLSKNFIIIVYEYRTQINNRNFSFSSYLVFKSSESAIKRISVFCNFPEHFECYPRYQTRSWSWKNSYNDRMSLQKVALTHFEEGKSIFSALCSFLRYLECSGIELQRIQCWHFYRTHLGLNERVVNSIIFASNVDLNKFRENVWWLENYKLCNQNDNENKLSCMWHNILTSIQWIVWCFCYLIDFNRLMCLIRVTYWSLSLLTFSNSSWINGSLAEWTGLRQNWRVRHYELLYSANSVLWPYSRTSHRVHNIWRNNSTC